MPVPRNDEARPNPVFWYAGRDFNTQNLTCQRGDPLPNRWQHREQVSWLRRQYGAEAVLDAEQLAAAGAGVPQPPAARRSRKR